MSRLDIPTARALHAPFPGMVPPSCRTCRDGDEEPSVWPCPTAEALGAEQGSPYVTPWGATSTERIDYPCLCDDEWVDDCPQHVSCDIGCKALNEPHAAEEWKAAAQHWRGHAYISGCSHGH